MSTKRKRRADNGNRRGPSAIAGNASELAAEVATFESLTARIAESELSSHDELEQSAELLRQAAESHRRFVERLRALIEQIDDARRRQNESAVTLSRHTAKLEKRRQRYQQLQQRFDALGTAATELGALLREGGADGESLRTAVERLRGTANAAQQLVAEARAAGLVDLEGQADALWQKLEALRRALASAQS